MNEQAVPYASAVVPGESDAEPIAIHADHINMVKFTSKEDPGYEVISGQLRLMVRDAEAAIELQLEKEQSDHESSTCLQSLPARSTDAHGVSNTNGAAVQPPAGRSGTQSYISIDGGPQLVDIGSRNQQTIWDTETGVGNSLNPYVTAHQGRN